MDDVVGSWEKLSSLRQDELSDDELLELVQRQTFAYFWDYAHETSGMARDRGADNSEPDSSLVATGGTGMGVMTMIVAAERGWVQRPEVMSRIARILSFLEGADTFRGVFPHYYDGDTGEEFSFWEGNAGGDIVETAFLMVGLLCARQYFDGSGEDEKSLRRRIDRLWHKVEWSWFAGGEHILFWHWGHKHGWATRHRMEGWDECLIAYVLAASSPTFPIGPEPYHVGWAAGRTFNNGQSYYGVELPLGPEYGGPLFFSHLPFLGLDPRGLKDRYGDYGIQTRQHSLVHYKYCVRNPKGYAGYGPDCWGLTASDGNEGYAPHAPNIDCGVIAPTAAISSMPYTPKESMQALRNYYHNLGDRIWRNYGFVDAFNLGADWYATDHLAVDQAPIIIMIENHRTGLLWRLFMSCPEVQKGLDLLGFDPRPSA